MASKHRLGVALVLDPPIAHEVDGLRRAVGDASLGRIGPHLTLVPPVNVRHDRLSEALATLRAAAATLEGPLRLTLGPPGTFLPANPVLYLGVGGDLERLRTLRDAVFRPPLERPLSWPWVPHVTLADDAPEARIAAALLALDRYAAIAPIDRLVLFEEDARQWHPLADASLGPPAIVGRGGLEVELTRGRLLDPEAKALLGEAVSNPFPARREDPFPIVLTARIQGKASALGAAWGADDGAQVGVFVAPSARGQGLGGIVLAHLEAAVRVAGWDCEVLHACGPAGFYRARSAWALAEGD